MNATRTAILSMVAGVGALSGCVLRSDNPSGGGSSSEPYLDTYERCDFDDECFDQECWLITVDYEDASVSDAMCTYQCNDDRDCDYGGYCIAVSDEPPLCYEPCFDDSDCEFGFACVADEFGYDPVCLPW